MEKPINFIDNHFIYEGGDREYFKGSKSFISLPNKRNEQVTNMNIWNYAKQIVIPISQLASSIAGKQFINDIKLEECETYDIETNDKEEFILGYVGDKRFTDPVEMIQEMKKYRCVYSFNGFRFDNEKLYPFSRKDFIEIRNANFIAHTLQGTLMIDLMSLIKNDLSHESFSAESIAKSLNFSEEIITHEDLDKDKKCQQDIRINRMIFKNLNIPKLFNTISTLINCDPVLWQIIYQDRLRKWILVNQYLKRGFLPLKKYDTKEVKLQEKPVHFSKKDFYMNYKYLDISSAYPRTVENLYKKGVKLGIYGNGDEVFSLLQIELSEIAKDSVLKPFMKGIANPMFGSQYSLNEYWRNEDIFNLVVSTVSQKVDSVLKERKDVVYVNTDCFIVPIDSEDVKIEGYEIKNKYEFSELYVYHSSRWVGKSKNRLEFRGFQRLNSRIPKIVHLARDELLEKLNDAKGDDFKFMLNETEKLVSKSLKGLKKSDLSLLKISVRKKTESCTDPFFANIWNELPMGFTDLYYKDNGEFTMDKDKIGFKYYKDAILGMAEEFNTEIQDE